MLILVLASSWVMWVHFIMSCHIDQHPEHVRYSSMRSQGRQRAVTRSWWSLRDLACRGWVLLEVLTTDISVVKISTTEISVVKISATEISVVKISAMRISATKVLATLNGSMGRWPVARPRHVLEASFISVQTKPNQGSIPCPRGNHILVPSRVGIQVPHQIDLDLFPMIDTTSAPAGAGTESSL